MKKRDENSICAPLNKISRKNIIEHLFRFFNSTECFRFCFLISLYMTTLCVAEKFFYVICGVLLVWSGYLLIYRLILKGRIKKVRYRRILYLFLGSGTITILIHSERNLPMNIIMLYIMAVCFFLFYGVHGEKSWRRCKAEMSRMLYFIMIATTIIMVIGLVVLAIFPKGTQWMGYSFAIHENRFVGIIFNANITAFYCVTAIVSAHILYRLHRAEKRLRGIRLFVYIGCSLINFIALFLSDSNDSLLFMIVYSVFLAFYFIFRDFHIKKLRSFMLRIIATTMACIVIVSTLIFCRVSMQSGVSLMITEGNSSARMSTGIMDENGEVIIAGDNERGTKAEQDNSTTFSHTNKNLDSGRFAMWRQSLCLFEKFPILGIGKANIVDYGKIYAGGLKYSDFHNSLITVLVSFGLVGLNLFMVLALTIAKAMIKAVFKYKDKCRKDGSILVLITAFCGAYFVYSMFEIALVMQYNFSMFIFWLMAGYGLSYVFKYRRQANTEGKETDNTLSQNQDFSDYLKERFIENKSAFME